MVNWIDFDYITTLLGIGYQAKPIR